MGKRKFSKDKCEVMSSGKRKKNVKNQKEAVIQGRGHGRYELTREVCCRLPTEKSFLPARVKGQDR